MKGYYKGRRLEWKFKKKLEVKGYTVFRCAGSKPVDLVALKGETKERILVECKHKIISGSELMKKLNLANRAGCDLIVAYPGKAILYYCVLGRPYEWKELEI